MFEGWLTSRAAQRQDRPGCSLAPLSTGPETHSAPRGQTTARAAAGPQYFTFGDDEERAAGRQDALQTQPQMLQRTTGWDGCGSFLSEGLRCITWNTRGLVGSVFSRQRNREFKLQYLK